MTPASLLKATAALFRDAGIPDPENDGAILLSAVCGKHPLALRLDTETDLDESALEKFLLYRNRRLRREPLQYIVGEAPFFGRMFYVDKRVLIPRSETELLCEWGLELLYGRTGCRILDLCCGSGCIGLTLLAERPDLKVSLSDISGEALSVAGINAVRFSLHPEFFLSDLAAVFPADSFDLIISNPPYIPSGECRTLQEEVLQEPFRALDGGPDGLDFYRRIALESLRVLRENGSLLMEIGFGEASAVSGILERAGYTDIRLRQDLNGIGRMILADVPARRNYV